MITEDGILKKIDNKEIIGGTFNVPEGIIEIGEKAFSNCSNLTNINLPKGIKKIDEYAFYNCNNLTNVNLPEDLTQIEIGAFYNCWNLENINLPEGLTKIGNRAFSNCTKLNNIDIPKKITKIDDWTFSNCNNLTSINLPKGLIEIGNCAFIWCRNLKNINLPENLIKIGASTFSWCKNITNIILPEGIMQIGEKAFTKCNKLKIIAKNINKEIIVVNLENILNFEINKSLTNDEINNTVHAYRIITRKINKEKIKLQNNYIESLINNGNIEDFTKKVDIKTFKSHIPNINELLKNETKEEQSDFYKFATVLGCFNAEKVLDENGIETQTKISQKSSALLAQLLRTNQLKIGTYHELFDSLSINAKASQEFLKFISPTGKGKNLKFENLELIMELEKKSPGIFVKIITDFEKVKLYRNCLDEKGKPITISWIESLQKFYLDNKYTGVTSENEDIAIIYASKGLSQQIFDKASRLRKIAKKKNVPAHILGKEIKEQSILETIEQKKSQTQEILLDTKQIIDEAYSKQFTYEWLSKYDPRNSIMGLYCSCCGSITSQFYGKNIAESTILAPDIQNIVIKNNKDEIIAKGTMYVNNIKGYGVINDFEVSQQYRNGISEDSKKEQQKQLIFESFMRGIYKFVEEYDKQNKDNPIKQINVGMGYNRLKKQVEKFEKATENLSIPAEYCFEDAMGSMQYVLYRKEGVYRNNFEGNNIDRER